MLSSYIAGRLVATVPVVFGISVLVFTLLRLTPGDPAMMIAGPQATAAELAAVRTSLGLDQPIPLQFVLWLGHALQGDLGRSSQLGVPVAPLVLDRFRNTLILALASLAVALVVAIPTGLISALHRRSPVDHGIMTVTLLANCMPPFWTGLMLIIVFASTLRWFPTGGMTDVLNPGGAQDVLWHLVLPAMTLGLPATALISRMMRASMLDVLEAGPPAHRASEGAEGARGDATARGEAGAAAGADRGRASGSAICWAAPRSRRPSSTGPASACSCSRRSARATTRSSRVPCC